MARVKRNSSKVGTTSKGKIFTSTLGPRKGRCMTPKTTRDHLRPLFPKSRRSHGLGSHLSPVCESDCVDERDVKPHRTGRCLHPSDGVSRRGGNNREGTMTCFVPPDSDHDSTSMTMPSGVSSFLLDCMDSGSPASVSSTESTLSSPEVFRKADTYEFRATEFPSEDELMELKVKNSTLLDVSHALDISMQQPPNLSSILDISQRIDYGVPEKRCLPGIVPLDILLTNIAPGSKGKTIATEEGTPQNYGKVVPIPIKKIRTQTGRIKPIKCRKKVTFRDPVHTKGNALQYEQSSEGGMAVSATAREAENVREVMSNEGTQTPVEPTHLSSDQAKFFDFADEQEKHMFFQRLRQRYSFEFPSKPIIFSHAPVSGSIPSAQVNAEIFLEGLRIKSML